MDDTNLNALKPISIVVYYWGHLVHKQSEGTHPVNQQQLAVADWLSSQKNLPQELKILASFTDNHLNYSKPKHFPELAKAIDYCMAHSCRLVIGKVNGFINKDAFYHLLATKGLDFVCLDKPLVTPESLHIVRQYVNEQSKQHSVNIKRGLQSTKQKLGNPYAVKAITPFNKIKTGNSVFFALMLQPVLAKYQQLGYSQRKMVAELNDAGIKAPEGGKWVLSQLQKILKRIETNNRALELSTQITKNNYNDFSAADLMAAFNQNNLKLSGDMELSEQYLTELTDRQKTIFNVVELYNFIQNWHEKIKNYILDGKSLDQIAIELNNNNIAIPNELADGLNSNEWSSILVSELVKRINHKLDFKYDAAAKDQISQDLENYINHANASMPTELAEIIVDLYKNPAFSKIRF